MLADIIAKVAGMTKTNNHAYYPRPSLADPHRCIRQLDYWRQGYQGTPMSDRSVLVLDDSSWHEELTADWIRKSAYKLHSEQMRVTSNGISGHIDGIVTDLNGTDILWEHKAINHFQFQRFQSGTEMPEGYFVQMAFYLDGLQKILPDIKKGVLLIKNKNTAQYLEYVVTYQPDTLQVISYADSMGASRTHDNQYPEIIAQALERFNEIEQYALSKSLHPRPYLLGKDWQCDPLYCQWSKICWNGYVEEIKTQCQEVCINSQYEPLLRRYQELKNKEDEAAAELAKARDTIIQTLIKAHAKTLVSGTFSATLSVSQQNRIDTKQLPPDIIRQYSKTSIVERLTVKEKTIGG